MPCNSNISASLQSEYPAKRRSRQYLEVEDFAEKLVDLDAIVINGGTGISARDGTTEVVKSLIDKELDGFGEIFRMLSFQQIGSAAIMSRAIAGVRKGKLIIALPGSPDACKLAMDQLIIPEIGHIVSLLRK